MALREQMARNAGSLVTCLIAIGMLFLSRAGYPTLALFVLAVWAMAVASAADTYINVIIDDHPTGDTHNG